MGISTPTRLGLSRRTFLAGLGATAAVAAAPVLAGCSTGPAKLQVMGKAGEITPEVIKQFETKFPDIKITLIETDQTRLNSMTAAGNPPDIVRDYGASSTAYVVSRGLALDLDEYVSKSTTVKEADIAKANDVWRWDGTKQGVGPRYGLAKDYSQDAMYWYNADLLASAGLKAPTADSPMSYEELLDQARELTKTKNGKTTRYGIWSTAPTTASLAPMVASAGGSLFSDDLKTIDLGSPECQRALQWMLDIAETKVGYTLANPNPEGWDGPAFTVGKIANANAGYWLGGQVSTVEKAWGSSRLAPAATFGPNRVSPVMSATGFWISAKSKMPDEAYTFLEWLCLGDAAAERAKSGWGLPSLTSLEANLPAKEEYQKEALAVQKNEQQYLQPITFTPYAQQTAIDATLGKVFLQAIKGTSTLPQVAEQANQEINELLAVGAKKLGS